MIGLDAPLVAAKVPVVTVGADMMMAMASKPDTRHEYVVEWNSAAWVAKCDCGWRSAPFARQVDAEAQAQRHADKQDRRRAS